ncbi:MAG: hypothetical protein R6V85_03045 [Polyangia bacterium]
MKKLTTTIATALAALLLATGVWAQESEEDEGFDGFPEPTTEQVDLEEAAEHAELLYTYVEDGTEWAVYLDEWQNHMWVQPAGMTTEEALFSEDEKGAPLSRTLLTPDAMYFEDDNGYYEYYYASQGDIWYYGSCGSHCQRWYVWSRHWENVETLAGRATSGGTYYAGYYGQYRDLDTPPYTDWKNSDNQTRFQYSGDWYYRNFEFDDPNGSDDWEYLHTPILRFIYYANNYWEYVELYNIYVE